MNYDAAMLGQVSSFRIEGLHDGNRNVRLQLVDNRAILVGENGTGKSTIVNLLYYVLTQQWRRITEYQFKSLVLDISDTQVSFSHQDVEQLAARATHLHRRSKGVYGGKSLSALDRASREHLAGFFADDIIIDPALSDAELAAYIEHSALNPATAQRLWRYRASREKLPDTVRRNLEQLNRFDFGQILYLPTYRRIEQDLKLIFRGLEIGEQVRKFRDRLRHEQGSNYVELVEFGMEDVETTIQSRMSQIKESVRTGLSALTGTYLREVLRGVQDAPDLDVLQTIDVIGFESILARIDEALLPAADKRLLHRKIQEITAGSPLRNEDKVIAHFLSKLVSLFTEQQRNETDVREFVALCNVYLTGKSFIYDDIRYTISIKQWDPKRTRFDGSTLLIQHAEGDATLELKSLSSGEKQIVSLFSHIYLSGVQDYFVVIDEPELSLSVPWQERFLPDISTSKRCNGLVAVTHSPFIWSNSLEKYVRSPADFVETVDAL